MEYVKMPLSEYAIYRISFSVLAVSLIYLGLDMMRGGGFYDAFFSRYWDYGEHHVALGIVFLAIGIWSAYGAIRRDPSSRR